MSTRSQIRFRITHDNGNETIAQVYRHSDGYPDAVIPDLNDLRNLQSQTGTHRGPTYTAANFILLMKLRGMRLYTNTRDDRAELPERTEDLIEPDSLTDLSQPHFLLGYGVEDPANGIHGDEEYLYVVDIPAGRDERSEWSVTVSEHSGFPRWDETDEFDDGETAFDHMEVAHSGTLADVLADVQVDH